MTPLERDRYLASRLNQIRWWNRLGWLGWAVLLGAVIAVHRVKPLYLDPGLLAEQIRMGLIRTDDLARLAALGNLAFWGCIGLLAGLILQTYVSMASERKLIRVFEALHLQDLNNRTLTTENPESAGTP